MIARSISRPISRSISRPIASFADANAAFLFLDFLSNKYYSSGNSTPVEKRFDEVIEFSRPSGGGIWNAQRDFEWLGSDVPRFDHDPVSKRANGILREMSRTNLVLYSQNLDNTYWTKIRSSLVPNLTIAPDGTLTADKIIEDTSNDTHYLGKTTVFGVSKTLTFSVFVKAAERTFVRVAFGGFAGQVASNTVSVNLLTGEYIPDDPARSRVIDAGNGWYRVSTTVTTNETGTGISPAVYCMPDISTQSYVGDGISGLYAWGHQVEEASFQTSYIPTVSSQVTREADNLLIPNGPWRSPNGRLEVDADEGVTVTLEADGIRVAGMGHVRSIKFYAEAA